MKKWLITGAALILILIRTGSGEGDIRDLEPVAAVQILTAQDGVRVLTDTGAEGYGANLTSALENLHTSAPNRIFLDTAQYLITDQTEYLSEIAQVMRPACRLCLAWEQVDLQLAAQYLKTHELKTTLGQYRAGIQDLPILYSKEGRSQLVP